MNDRLIRKARPAGLAAVLIAPLLAFSLMGCAPQGEEHVVTIDGLKYSPAELEIHPGDKVVWNMTSTGMAHDVVSNDGLFQSELLNEGEFSHTFTKEGEYGYHCTPHPTMTGMITVVAPE
ncbi:cupredoxin domain-containing protein [Leucobacter chinensis]|uniref:cupredoxin domain-containing protein n=1 Tax=Leucobacter chinensis TaxID=2851010 RepID=UPI001C2233BB|nr:cupredoxin family copper-binding protein [Leucobacter chinensis]